MIAATKNETMAMLHHGKNKQEQKLRTMVSNIEIINFIFLLLHELKLITRIVELVFLNLSIV